MRIHRVRVPEFKGVHLDIPWAPAMVLFGANDSGKTNVLEAFLSEFGPDGSVRQQATRREVRTGLDVELDGLEIEGHPDQEVFLGWFLSGNTDVFWYLITEDRSGDHDVLDKLNERLADARRRYAQLRWGGSSPSGIAGLLWDVMDSMREAWDTLLARGADFSELGIRSGEEAVRSHHFRVDAIQVQWLAPLKDASPYDMPAVELTGPPFTHARGIDSFLEPTGIRVIPIRPVANALAALRDRLESLLPALSERLGGPETRPDCADDAGMAKDGSGDAWLLRQDDRVGLRPSMAEACRVLARRVNELAPPFVSASYEVEIVPLLPDEWAAAGGHHVAVRLRTQDGSRAFEPELSSSGIATWTNLALSEAIRLTEHELDGRRAPTIYVFDEPETHLHPLAERQAAAWIAERARSGASVLLASHAAPFLDLPLPGAEYFRVSRSVGWMTEVERITGNVMDTVRDRAESMGLSPVALIQLTHGWLVVEGEHDRKIIEAFHGRELQEVGIQILPLRGANRAKASFLTLAALGSLKIPFFCLFDNVLAAAARGDRSTRLPTEEEKIAEQIMSLRRQSGVDVHVLGLRAPDIICALPIEAVREVAREHRKGKPEAASSWTDLLARFEERERGEKAPNFKSFVLETLGLRGSSVDWLVDEALVRCSDLPSEPSELARRIREIVARVDVARSPLPELPPDEHA